ncbi:MAG TPA: hypothetical protein VNL36_01585 [Bacteroidota bacterium]|nr:hypothetical protein [Bacteroidota bacterium]
MSLIKSAFCTQCRRKFFWKIERPGDGYWDRWKSDDGNTLASWFLSNNLCWDHAFEKMPERFRQIIRTELYEETEPQSPSGALAENEGPSS